MTRLPVLPLGVAGTLLCSLAVCSSLIVPVWAWPLIAGVCIYASAHIFGRISWVLYQREEKPRRELAERERSRAIEVAGALDALTVSELREIGIIDEHGKCTLCGRGR